MPASVTSSFTMSYAGAQSVSGAVSPVRDRRSRPRRNSAFLAGDQYAYIAGIIAVLIGAALVFFVFPKRDKEHEVMVGHHQAAIDSMGGK